MMRSRDTWALAIAAAIIVGCLAFLWLNTGLPTAPTTVEETNVDGGAPLNTDETPPSATGDLSDSN